MAGHLAVAVWAALEWRALAGGVACSLMDDRMSISLLRVRRQLSRELDSGMVFSYAIERAMNVTNFLLIVGFTLGSGFRCGSRSECAHEAAARHKIHLCSLQRCLVVLARAGRARKLLDVMRRFGDIVLSFF